MPGDGHFEHGDLLAQRNNENLNVKNPALSVHVGEDKIGGRARKHLEPTLRIANRADTKNVDKGVEPIHEEIANKGAVNHGVGFDHVCAGADRHYRGVGGLVINGGNQAGNVSKARGAIGIRKDGVVATEMAHAVRNCTALATVLLQAAYTQGAGGKVLFARPSNGVFGGAVG